MPERKKRRHRNGPATRLAIAYIAILTVVSAAMLKFPTLGNYVENAIPYDARDYLWPFTVLWILAVWFVVLGPKAYRHPMSLVYTAIFVAVVGWLSGNVLPNEYHGMIEQIPFTGHDVDVSISGRSYYLDLVDYGIAPTLVILVLTIGMALKDAFDRQGCTRIREGDPVYDCVTDCIWRETGKAGLKLKLPPKEYFAFYIVPPEKGGDVVNAYTKRGRRIFLHQALLDTLAEKDGEERIDALGGLCGVVCHEMGHAVHDDCTTASAAYCMIGFLSIVQAAIFAIGVFILAFVASLLGVKLESHGIVRFLITLVEAVVIYIVYLLGGRVEERQADMYAVKAGYGSYLAKFLETYAPDDGIPLLRRLLDPHPSTKRRAAYLRKADKELRERQKRRARRRLEKETGANLNWKD